MMHLTALWAKARGVKCSVVTVDHGLRAESAIEAEFVKSAAKVLGLSHKTLRWNGAEHNGNTNERKGSALSPDRIASQNMT